MSKYFRATRLVRRSGALSNVRMRVVCAGLMMAGHNRRAEDISEVFALPADSCAVEELTDAVAGPLTLRHSRHGAVVEVGRDGSQAVSSEQAFCHLRDDRRLVGNDRDAVLGVPVWASATAAHLPILGELELLARQAAALVVTLCTGHGSEDTSMEAAVMGAEVDLAGHTRQVADARAIAEVEESSNSRGRRWRRSRWYTMTASRMPAARSSSMRSYSGRLLPE